MSDERSAVVRICRNGVERFHDRAEEWVPDAIRVEGDVQNVVFRVLFTDIDKEIERSEKATSFQVRDAIDGTTALLQELGDEGIVVPQTAQVTDLPPMISDDQVSCVSGATNPKEIWDEKNEWFAVAKESKEHWDNVLTEDQRDALVRIVQNGIGRFHYLAADLVPDKMKVEGGQFLDITFSVTNADIDNEVARYEADTSAQLSEAKAGVEKLLADLGEDAA